MKLYNVLKAISIFSHESGYVQGMNYLVAILLMYMEEEEAFWAMVSILKHYDHEKYFLPGMPGLWESFYVFEKLLKDQVPKVYNHFNKLHIWPSMYASQWFITIFTVGWKFENTVRVFDAFLGEGEKILYRIALYVMKANKDQIISGGTEELFAVIRLFLKNIDENELLQKAWSIKITRKQILKYAQEYKEDKDKQDEVEALD